MQGQERNIALIGFMAAGKTTVGRALASRLGYSYVDTDERIVARANRSIPEIFATEGEAGFRAAERAAVREVCTGQRQVIACGGGLARDPDNVSQLREAGLVVYLRLTPETATERILADGAGRPMIDRHVAERTPEAVLTRVRELLNERAPYYEAAADVVVDVDGRSVEAIVEAILAAYGAGHES